MPLNYSPQYPPGKTINLIFFLFLGIDLLRVQTSWYLFKQRFWTIHPAKYACVWNREAYICNLAWTITWDFPKKKESSERSVFEASSHFSKQSNALHVDSLTSKYQSRETSLRQKTFHVLIDAVMSATAWQTTKYDSSWCYILAKSNLVHHWFVVRQVIHTGCFQRQPLSE